MQTKIGDAAAHQHAPGRPPRGWGRSGDHRETFDIRWMSDLLSAQVRVDTWRDNALQTLGRRDGTDA